MHTVTILTFCNKPELLYGSLLVFKTLRVGFPTARVIVFDNGSHPDAKKAIQQAAAATCCEFRAMERKPYWKHFEWLLFEQNEFASTVIADPDLVFWKSVEHWQFPQALMAGRFIPNLAHLGCSTVERLHPSHLWISNIDEIRRVKDEYPAWSLISPSNAGHLFIDTFSALYQLTSNKCHRFTDEELDHYDHLFFGSHLPMVKPAFAAPVIRKAHEDAERDCLYPLRGIWRAQDRLFGGSKPDPATAKIFGGAV